VLSLVFFFNDTAPTQIYTLSLHDALPISARIRSYSSGGTTPPVGLFGEFTITSLVFGVMAFSMAEARTVKPSLGSVSTNTGVPRSEEHTSELQSRGHLVCRLLLEKKNTRL